MEVVAVPPVLEQVADGGINSDDAWTGTRCPASEGHYQPIEA